MATSKKAPPLNQLEQLARQPQALLGLLLWQNRIKNPDMAVAITPKDREGMAKSMEYLKVEPEVRAFVRGDRVLVAMVDKKSRIVVRRQVAGEKDGKPILQDKDVDLEPGEAPQPGDVIVSIGNGIRPIEDNEQDFDAAAREERLRAARTQGVALAGQVKASAQAGTFSAELVAEVCDALVLLAGQS